MKTLGLLLCGLLVFVANVAYGADLQKGLHAAQNGDYTGALAELRPLAEQGDPVAQYNLGRLYVHGQGVLQDYSEGMTWYSKAAVQGLAHAQSDLGLMYANGKGVPRNYSEADAWFRKAAAQGDAKAQGNLGLMYANGRGVPRDYAEAIEWYGNAAAQGNAVAQYDLGFMYANGRGVRQDFVAAYALYAFSASALNSNPNVALMVANNRSKLLRQMTPPQVDAGQTLTSEMRRVGVMEALRSHSNPLASYIWLLGAGICFIFLAIAISSFRRSASHRGQNLSANG